MAAIALVTANRVRVVESIVQVTGFSGILVNAGTPVRYDADGRYIPALGTTAPNALLRGVATQSVNGPRLEMTVIRQGTMDGWDFGSNAYGAVVYLADVGGIDSAAGTVSTKVGDIVAMHAQSFGVAPDKGLYINIV